VICGAAALRQLGGLVVKYTGTRPIFVLSSRRVWDACGPKIQRALRGANVARVILFDDRESAKSVGTAETLCRKLIRAGARRDAVLVAVGGGVVGDVAGFVAAIFLRGVALVHVPTTLLAQVDSAMGGKTGVNLPEGKNLMGVFHQPRLVVCDPALPGTLPERQFRAGLFEVVKYAVIADEHLFELLEVKLAGISRRDTRGLMEIIPRCVRIKAAIVEQDEREGGVRAILNFGHTVGHALEATTRYRRFLHGEAVAWGMLAATLVAVAFDKLDPADASRIIHLIVRTGPLPTLPKLSASRIWAAIQRDKKSRGGVVRWMLPVAIGRAEYGIALPPSAFRRVWVELPKWESECRKAQRRAAGFVKTEGRR
jgi:3-dehydroquinate synthase